MHSGLLLPWLPWPFKILLQLRVTGPFLKAFHSVIATARTVQEHLCPLLLPESALVGDRMSERGNMDVVFEAMNHSEQSGTA